MRSEERLIDEEMAFHIAEERGRQIALGVDPVDADHAARREFGSVALARESTRHVWRPLVVEQTLQDLRFVWRTTRRAPAFAAAIVVTLALGIGANAAIYTLFKAVVLEPLPVRDPDRLVLFTRSTSEGTHISTPPPSGTWELFSTAAYRFMRDHASGFTGVTAVRSGEATANARLDGIADARTVRVHPVAGNYFAVMGVAPAAGRLLRDDDDRPEATPAAVVSDAFWRQRLGGDAAAVGRTLTLNRTIFTIVGVTPPEFFGERIRRSADVWVPLRFQPDVELRDSYVDRDDTYWLTLIGRLAPGVTIETAQRSADATLRQFLLANEPAADAARQADIDQTHVALVDGRGGISPLRQRYAQPLRALFVVVALILLVACANVASLVLSSMTARRAELGTRLALGSSRARLVRQLLTESVVLALAGGVLALLLSRWLTSSLLALAGVGSAPIRPATGSPDAVMLTAGLAVVTGLAVAIPPAWFALRSGSARRLEQSGRGGTTTREEHRTASALVVVQVAISLVLLFAAGLFARSLMNLQSRPLGFDPAHVLVARTNARLAGYSPETAGALYRSLLTRLAALPGVEHATVARYSPFGGASSVNTATIDRYTPAQGERVAVETVQVGPLYIDTLGMTLLRGRAIDDRDRPGAPKVAMVNEAFARRFLRDADPIGRRFALSGTGATPDIEIVGVVGDAQFQSASDPPRPMAFTPMLQEQTPFALDGEIAIRTAGDPAAIAGAVRRAVKEVDAGLPVADFVPLQRQVDNALATERLTAHLVGGFSLLALLLACVGLYGTLIQRTARRMREMAVRMALGAIRRDVVWLIVKGSLSLVGAGLLIGIPLALASARFVTYRFYGVAAADPMSLAAAALALALVGAVTGLIPAVRASRLDPSTVLREE